MKTTRSRTPEDEALLERLFKLLRDSVPTAPGSDDSEFISQIRRLPVGLRAMAATHHLDISLTLDDLGWHFLNWPGTEHANETFIGLRELGLPGLAGLFRRAEEIMRTYLPHIDTKNYYDILERGGRMTEIDDLTRKAWEIVDGDLYDHWLRYARVHPENTWPNTAPNGGPGTQRGNSEITERPPSVS